VRLGFERLRRSSLVGVTRPEHVASRRVLEKVGLRFEREFLLAGERAALFRTGV
jgi:RimJ/RimL family protein N-acetyltransferase